MTSYDSDMPDDAEFDDAQAGASVESESDKALRMAEIERFADIIKGKRNTAIEGRRASGIEEIWAEDEDHYEGGEKYGRTALEKGKTADSGLTQTRKKIAGRSTAFANITRPYCDAASARVADMLLPTDDRNWAIRVTPDPKLINSRDDTRGAVGPDGQPMMRAAQPQPAQAQAAQPGMMSRMGGAIAGMFGGQQVPQEAAPQQQPVTVGELAQKIMGEATKSAERAQTVIDDWLTECRYHAEVRKVIECTARLGVGILKGPHATKRRARAISKTPEGWKLAMEIKTDPASVFVSPWNFYPDPNCGDTVASGAYTFERGDMIARGIKDLKDEPGYINEMIDQCIEEGPISASNGAKRLRDGDRTSDNDLFEIWYFNGQVSKKDMQAAGCECELDEAPCVVTMVNDRIIKITMSPLDSGEFPYDVMVWQEKIGHWAGIGVSRQMRTCQKGLNGGVRAMQDNAGISSGPQIIVDSSKIEPADGKWIITPNKLWRKKLDAEEIGDVRDAFTVISIETRQVELLNIIHYWTKTAEDVTGLPMLLQGQQGSSPDTLGATQIVNNNGSTVLRRIARTFDDRVTEPHIGRYYEWLLMHGPEDAKGEFQVDARGSSALVERDMQNRSMMQLLGASINPAYMLDPEKVMQEVLKGMRLDPKGVALDEEQKKAMSERQPPEDPRITAAKIMAESKKEAIGADMQKSQMALQASQQESALDRDLAQRQMEIDAQLASAELSSAERRDLEKQKVLLASVTLRLQVQERMSGAGIAHQKDVAMGDHRMAIHTSTQAIAPAAEPYQRAPDGQAFTQ